MQWPQRRDGGVRGLLRWFDGKLSSVAAMAWKLESVSRRCGPATWRIFTTAVVVRGSSGGCLAARVLGFSAVVAAVQDA